MTDDGDPFRAAGTQVLVLEDGLFDGAGPPTAVLDRPVDGGVPGLDQHLLEGDVLGEALGRARRSQALRHVGRQPRTQVVAERPLLLGQVDVHPLSLTHRPAGPAASYVISDGVSD